LTPARNVQKEFLIGQSSRSHGWILVWWSRFIRVTSLSWHSSTQLNTRFVLFYIKKIKRTRSTELALWLLKTGKKLAATF